MQMAPKVKGRTPRPRSLRIIADEYDQVPVVHLIAHEQRRAARPRRVRREVERIAS